MSLNISLSHSRSFEMTPLSRACASTISIPFKLCWYLVPFMRYSVSNNVVTLKSGLRVAQMVPFESLGAVSYPSSIATMAVPCIISEIHRDVGLKSQFFIPLLRLSPLLGGPRWNIIIPFGIEKWHGYPTVKKFEDTFSRLDRLAACDGQTDRWTDRQTTDVYLATA